MNEEAKHYVVKMARQNAHPTQIFVWMKKVEEFMPLRFGKFSMAEIWDIVNAEWKSEEYYHGEAS